MTKRINNIDRGFPNVEFGLFAAGASCTTLSLTAEAKLILLSAPRTNTDTVWVGFNTTTATNVGYPLYTESTVSIPYHGERLFFYSAGGSSVVSYIAFS